MTLAQSPRSVRMLGWLFLGMAIAGAMEVAAGVLELLRLAANSDQALASATFVSDAEQAISNLEAAAKIAIWVGVAGVLALLARYLVLRAGIGARVIAWAVCGAFFFGQMGLMAQDSSIGLHPYVDVNRDVAMEELINSLITAPGYFLLLYSAEVAGLVLGVWAAVLLRGEDTVEFLRVRTQAASDPAWDAVMAAKRSRRGA